VAVTNTCAVVVVVLLCSWRPAVSDVPVVKAKLMDEIETLTDGAAPTFARARVTVRAARPQWAYARSTTAPLESAPPRAAVPSLAPSRFAGEPDGDMPDSVLPCELAVVMTTVAERTLVPMSLAHSDATQKSACGAYLSSAKATSLVSAHVQCGTPAPSSTSSRSAI
jgi:hypothetical protein